MYITTQTYKKSSYFFKEGVRENGKTDFKILPYSYTFGFNGQEKDNEIKGIGNSLDFGARIYDSRLGRFLSRDVYSGVYPNLSHYQYCNNNPIYFIELGGRHFTGNKVRIDQIKASLLANPNPDALKFHNDIVRMENSPIEFYIKPETGNLIRTELPEGGITYFDFANNRLIMEAYEFAPGYHKYEYLTRLVHELEHGRQFMDNEIAFLNHDSKSIDLFHDKTDEYNAFKMQFMFEKKYISEHGLKKIVDENYSSSKKNENEALDWPPLSVGVDELQQIKSGGLEIVTGSLYNPNATRKESEKGSSKKSEISDRKKDRMERREDRKKEKITEKHRKNIELGRED